MNILRPVDIENEARKALMDYMTVYCRPLPENYSLPCILVSATGGSSDNTIDTFTLRLDSRAETAEDAYEYLATALGLLEAQADAHTGALRHVITNSLASWGSDPVRPDLKLCTATLLVTAHRESFEISDS